MVGEIDGELQDLAQKLGLQMCAKKCLLATAESCTGGWVAQTVTAIAGSSAWFDRGFITYSNEAKCEMLGVSQQTLADEGAVSEATAKEMVSGVLKNSRATLGLAITGIAGPGGGSVEKPVGTVWIAWARRDGRCLVRRYCFEGERQLIRAQAVRQALHGAYDMATEI